MIFIIDVFSSLAMDLRSDKVDWSIMGDLDQKLHDNWNRPFNTVYAAYF
jgi:hypothetical protein